MKIKCLFYLDWCSSEDRCNILSYPDNKSSVSCESVDGVIGTPTIILIFFVGTYWIVVIKLMFIVLEVVEVYLHISSFND